MTPSAVHIRDMIPSDQEWAESLVAREFASTRVVSRGRLHHVRELPGLVAEQSGGPVGLLQYLIEDRSCEVVILVAEVRRQGIGTRLIQAVRMLAAAAGCRRLWLVTTNDNLPAMACYRKAGWAQVAVHRGAVRQSRLLKPEIPERSSAGIPIEDEIEFAIEL